MGKINYGRVVLGGVVGGIISFVLWWFFNGVLLFQLWVAATNALNPSGHNAASPPALLASMLLIGIASEILAIWMYAVIRSRFGAGVRTAIVVSVFLWIVEFLLPNAAWSTTGFFSRRLLLYNALAGLVLGVAGTVVGAALYKEEATANYPVAEAGQALR
jgi:hypothetical protein